MRPIHALKRLTAALLVCAMASSGCAGARAPRVAPPPSGTAQASVREALAEYVRRLPPGAFVRVDRASASSIRGTLIKAGEDSLVIQPRTRVAVPPVEIPMADVLRVTPDSPTGNAIAKAIGIGAAAGVGAALVVFAVIAAALD